jgi:WD40 repeat protein
MLIADCGTAADDMMAAVGLGLRHKKKRGPRTVSLSYIAGVLIGALSALIAPSISTAQTVAFSPDSRLLIGASYHSAVIVDTSVGEIINMLPPAHYESASFSADGKYIATAISVHDYVIVQIWDAVLFNEVSRKKLSGYIAYPKALSFNPSDSRVLGVATSDGAHIWNWRAGKAEKAEEGDYTIAFFGSKRLLTGSESEALITDERGSTVVSFGRKFPGYGGRRR